jgi:hypothetical protein
MKILYLSCHSILEYDEVKLLHELGHEVFSPGAYVEPDNPGDASLRPSIPGLSYDEDLLKQWHKLAGEHPGEDTKDYLTKEFVDNFDCVIVMHLPRWIERNWDAIKHKRVIWRTIGQSIPTVEVQLAKYRKQGMQIVRYSPKETTLDRYIGDDALIRFYKDPDEYGPWTGENKRVITFAQHMAKRNAACNYQFFENTTRPFERHLFGPGNEGKEWTSGKVPYEQLKREMCENRVYFYTGTHPASYTLNFMEAWMTGMPIVAIGNARGNAPYFPGVYLYEVGELIENGVTGFVSDQMTEIRKYITDLFNDDAMAQEISKNARAQAIKVFGRDTIAPQWKEFLGE